jgi:DNA-binding transcriptional ArsR family regulator
MEDHRMQLAESEREEEQLDAVFGALADPTRRTILARLAEGDASVTELWGHFTVSQPAISQHLKVLERAGLITRRRRGTARLSHLEAEPLRDAVVWLAGYREYWEESYERLDELLARLQERDRPERADREGGSSS